MDSDLNTRGLSVTSVSVAKTGLWNVAKNELKRKGIDMAKILVELTVPGSNYCEREDTVCPMCFEHEWGDFRCVLFDEELELDENHHHYCIRCDECRQAEVPDEE